MHTRYMPLMLLMLVTAGSERGAPSSPSSIASSGLGDASGHQHMSVEITPDMRQQLAALHPLFARYHDLDQAIADGYEFVGPCVSDPGARRYG
jgi:hypothetical protein